MTINQLKKLITERFQYQPTDGQSILISIIAEFLLDQEARNLLVIKGYAGTGKTSIVKAIVKVLEEYEHGTVLLAPTGRSAKVLANYSECPAYTIHKKIYKLDSDAEGNVKINLLPNLHINTLFVVDEASMISVSSNIQTNTFSQRSLLNDLIEYIYNGHNCRLILIGDTAQLPPVGTNISPALDINFLQASYNLKLRSFELTEVVRQEAHSGILYNATLIRKLLVSEKKNYNLKFNLKKFNDIISLNGEELEDELNSAYSNYGAEETIVICRSNKRANLFNQQIRAKIFSRESDITGGDLLMVVKNNYFWLPENSKVPFIANGEIMKVQRIKGMQELYGFHFAEARVSFPDYPDENSIDVLLLSDTLNSESPSLSVLENKKLYETILEEYQDIHGKRKQIQKVKENKYYNALQIKFALALTCHKSQGGQWKAVFIEQGYLKDNILDKDYLRWLYTALTRATEKVYLVNFNEKFL